MNHFNRHLLTYHLLTYLAGPELHSDDRAAECFGAKICGAARLDLLDEREADELDAEAGINLSRSLYDDPDEPPPNAWENDP